VTIEWDKVDGVVFDFGGVLSVSPMKEKWTPCPYCETPVLWREKMPAARAGGWQSELYA